MRPPYVQKPNSQVAQYFFGSPQHIAEKILFIKRETRLADYRVHLAGVTEFGNVWRGITGAIRGEPISIIARGIGPSMAGDCASALDRPGAVCLYSGTCGSLDPAIDIGDYILAERALCGDGFTALLGIAPYSPVETDPQLLARLADAFRIAGIPCRAVTSFTTASAVCENDPGFWTRVPSHCQSIEMGCAAFYAACQRTGKRPAAYFWVTDLPLHGKSFYDPLSPSDQAKKQAAYDRSVALDLSIIASL